MISDKCNVFSFSIFYFFVFCRESSLRGINSMQRIFPVESEKKNLYNFNEKKVQVVVSWSRIRKSKCKSRSFFRVSSSSTKPSAFNFWKFRLRMEQRFAEFPEKRKASVVRYTLYFPKCLRSIQFCSRNSVRICANSAFIWYNLDYLETFQARFHNI